MNFFFWKIRLKFSLKKSSSNLSYLRFNCTRTHYLKKKFKIKIEEKKQKKRRLKHSHTANEIIHNANLCRSFAITKNKVYRVETRIHTLTRTQRIICTGYMRIFDVISCCCCCFYLNQVTFAYKCYSLHNEPKKCRQQKKREKKKNQHIEIHCICRVQQNCRWTYILLYICLSFCSLYDFTYESERAKAGYFISFISNLNKLLKLENFVFLGVKQYFFSSHIKGFFSFTLEKKIVSFWKWAI